ncbi:MAG TPA: hypothetical protein VFZ37_22010 [Jiangellaceae bacterium]
MDTFTSPASAGSVAVSADPLRLAMSAYLARFKGISREHTYSDLHLFVTWCTGHGVQPLAAQRGDLELFVRWMQETRRFKPSTVARRTSVVAGFYRTCVIDGVLDHSPAEYVRRPSVPPESPTLGLTHLQFEVMLTAARESSNTMLDAGVDLRDVQIAARHADPRTTMRYDRARKNLDRHPNYILAAYMASGT